jgi:hypothetical protein
VTTANLTRDETAARAAVIHVDTIAVELDLREAQRPEGETFPTTATLTFTSTADATWIDFLGASVDEVVVNGVAQPVEWDGARIAVSGLVAHNVVTVRGHGRYSTSGEGLHLPRSRGRRDLPVHAVRAGGLPPRLPLLRAARPQGPVDLHGVGTRRLAGALERRRGIPRGHRRGCG